MTRIEAAEHLHEIRIHSGWALRDVEIEALTQAIAALQAPSGEPRCSECGGTDLEDTSAWCNTCQKWIEIIPPKPPGPSVDEIQEYCRHHYDDQMAYRPNNLHRGAAQAYWNVMRRIEEGT